MYARTRRAAEEDGPDLGAAVPLGRRIHHHGLPLLLLLLPLLLLLLPLALLLPVLPFAALAVRVIASGARAARRGLRERLGQRALEDEFVPGADEAEDLLLLGMYVNVWMSIGKSERHINILN